MVPYDRHKWLGHLFGWRRSILPLVLPRMVAFTAWAGLISLGHKLGYVPSVPPMLHTVLGTVLGLILAFRTNTAYDRYWEGRRSWGTITNRCRDLARQCKAFVPEAETEKLCGNLIVGFVHAFKRHLWREETTPELVSLLGDTEARTLELAPGPSQRTLLRLTELLRRERALGHITDLDYTLMDRNLTELVDQVGVCQRIQRTPIPFAYVIFLRRFIISYLATLPLALDQDMTWGVPAFMVIVSYAMLGLEEIGVQVEDPFDRSPHDLNLDRISMNIERDVLATIAAAPHAGAARTDVINVAVSPSL